MTFSISARCAATGQLGIAIASSSPAVASQNVTDPRLGPAALDLLAGGAPAHAALDHLVATRDHLEHRQLVVVDTAGRTAVWSGRHALGVYASAEGRECAAAGNLLANQDVVAAMVRVVETGQGELGGRLMAALAAGLAAGGEAGPVHSAGLLVAATEAWPITDLRVDWDEADPVGRLHTLFELWQPQRHAYVQRALDPGAAPGFAVPGAGQDAADASSRVRSARDVS